jgi:hypothetical protein
MEGTPCLKCDVEIDYKSVEGADDTDATVAAALRELATQIESGAPETGFHPVKTATGKEIGEVYLDHYATL